MQIPPGVISRAARRPRCGRRPASHQALGLDRSIGLLPCNVVVRATADGTLVEALDPHVMVTLTGRPELKPVADEVGRRLARALSAIASLRRLRRHAMDSSVPGADGDGRHVGFRTMCGRRIRVGHLVLGGGNHPAQRVTLNVGPHRTTETGPGPD